MEVVWINMDKENDTKNIFINESMKVYIENSIVDATDRNTDKLNMM